MKSELSDNLEEFDPMPDSMETSSPIKILYVDDELALLELGKIYLEKSSDIKVDICRDSIQSLRHLSVNNYDVIISDFQMPKMDGIQLLRALRESGNKTPFIILTGKGREDVAISALNSGADFYLQKGGKPSAQFAELENMVRHLAFRSDMKIEVSASEAKYKSLFENAADAIIIMDENNFLECNRGCELLFKCPREQLISHSPIELSPPLQPNGMESSLMARKYIDLALKGQRQEFEWVHLDSNKQPFIADVSLSRVFINGTFRLHSIVRDKTAQILLKQELKESEQKYRRLTENATDIIYRFELIPVRKFSYVSPSVLQISGYTPEEHYADPDLGMKIIHPDDVHNLQKLFRESKDISQPICFRWVKKNGDVIWTEQRNVPIYDDHGQVIAMEGIARDITESKRLQNELEEANKKLQLLSGITRHDILNLLTVLQGYFELSLSSDGKEHETCVENVRKAIAEVTRIISFTREYEQLGVKKPEWYTLSEIINKNCAGSLPVNIPKQDYELYGDAMLEKVFSNLMDNSLRHATNATAITVECEEKDGALMISWKDNGPGVATDQKEKIFSRGIGRNGGFGLFLTKEILSITGMDIKESGTPGQGVCFVITVPKGHFRPLNE